MKRPMTMALGVALLAFAGAAPAASAATTAGIQNRVLKVTGDAAANKVAFGFDTTGTGVAIDIGEDGTTDFDFSFSDFDAVDVQTGGGNDEVRVLNGTFTTKAVTINGGDGSDTILAADETDVLVGGAGKDFIRGGRGNDTAQLGAGDDTFSWDPGDGSDFVEGGDGHDVVDFHGSNAAESISVTANGSRAILHRDIADVTTDTGTVEDLLVHALGSADTITVGDLTGTALTRPIIDLGGDDAALDTVTVDGTAADDNVTATQTANGIAVKGLATQTLVTNAVGDLVQVDGGPGTDTLTYPGTAGPDDIGVANVNGVAAAFGLTDVPVGALTENFVIAGGDGADTITGQNGIALGAKLTIQGGAGDDVLRGGDGDDVLSGGIGNDVVDGNRGNDIAQLGSGNDTFQWDPGDGSDAVEGNDGTDTLAFHGSNIGEKIDISANGSRARLQRDVAAITMDLGTMEGIVVSTLGGVDTVTVGDLAGTSVTHPTVDFGGDDAAIDTVVVDGTAGDDNVKPAQTANGVVFNGLAAQTRVTNPGPGDIVDVDGGAGTDKVTYAGTVGADNIGVANAGGVAAAFGLTDVPVGALTENLVVAGGDGPDVIAAQNGLAGLTRLTLKGEGGDDDVRGGDGDDVVSGGSGNDLVDGNRGSDTVQGDGGNDTFQWDPGDGSDFVSDTSGDDTFRFNGANIAERIALNASGSHVLLTRDVAAITTDTVGLEHVVVNALGGSDTITIGDLKGTSVKTADLNLAGFDGNPDATPDAVFVDGTPLADNIQVTASGNQVAVSGVGAVTRITGTDQFLDSLEVFGLDGHDVATIDPGVFNLINAVVDLGTQ